MTDYGALLEQELTRIVAALKELGARKIILFGSYAQGRNDPFTDLDLIAVLDSNLPIVERTGEVYRRLAPRVAADILVYTPAEWESMAERPFVREVLRKGKILYEKNAG